MSDLPPAKDNDERTAMLVIAFIFCGFMLGIGVLFVAVVIGG